MPPSRDMITQQMDEVCDGDRLASRPIEMRGHTLQQHEWVIIDQNDPATRTDKARRFGIEAGKIGDVADDKGRDRQTIPAGGEACSNDVRANHIAVDSL